MDNFIAHILVVDDDDGIRSLVKKYLNENNYLVTTANSSENAVEKVKIINPKIKTIHYVAPQVWVWRESRVKKIKNFIDHILLLFDFEKKYFDKENILFLYFL